MDKLGDVPAASEADVDRAVTAAKAGFREWSRVSIKERARCLMLLAERVEKHADELALMDAVDSGNAIVGMRGDMTWTADSLRYFAGLITEIKGETSSQGPRHINLTRRQPYGVVAKINPFNHPFRFCAEKAAAPLAAGNCVVIKGSEQAPLSSLRLGELCEGIFPKGVVNIITGDGATGAALVRHPGRAAHRLCRLGAHRAARSRARQRSGIEACQLRTRREESNHHFSRCRSEESGRRRHQGHEHEPAGAILQLDLARVRAWFAAQGGHRGTGQAGGSPADRRAVAEGKRCRPDRLAAPARPHHGVSSRSAKSEGAKLLTGGGKPADKALHRGLFIAPTVFDAVTPAMRIGREEIFGPVMSVLHLGRL